MWSSYKKNDESDPCTLHIVNQNDPEAKASPDHLVGSLPRLGRRRVIGAPAEAKFLWMVQYEMFFPQDCRHFDSAQPQGTH